MAGRGMADRHGRVGCGQAGLAGKAGLGWVRQGEVSRCGGARPGVAGSGKVRRQAKNWFPWHRYRDPVQSRLARVWHWSQITRKLGKRPPSLTSGGGLVFGILD